MALRDDWDKKEERWSDPDSMSKIDDALQLDSVAPQWQAPSSLDGTGYDAPQQRITPLRTSELKQVEAMVDQEHPLSELERSLLQQSLDSLDYLGNWADPDKRDSIVLTCQMPSVIEGENGPEYTCAYDEFTAERHELHSAIIEKMLTSTRTTAGGAASTGVDQQSRAVEQQSASAVAAGAVSAESAVVGARVLSSAVAAGASAASVVAGGPPAMPLPDPSDQHVFVVVGVPGSGKDTVLKRYLRSLGLPLLDASADLVKEYLAAWGQDELSRAVRENNAHRGPGKHLLHAQYLHRESIMLCDAVVDRALDSGKDVLLEKTLFDLEPVLKYVRDFRSRGCKCHLLATHIQPLRNWRFLETRMASGQAFGRIITKQQAVTGISRYQKNLEELLETPELRDAFDSLHVYDVMEERWCVSLDQERARAAKAA